MGDLKLIFIPRTKIKVDLCMFNKAVEGGYPGIIGTDGT